MISGPSWWVSEETDWNGGQLGGSDCAGKDSRCWEGPEHCRTQANYFKPRIPSRFDTNAHETMLLNEVVVEWKFQFIKSFIFAEPAACQEFRGEGSVDEFGRQDVKLETTGKLRWYTYNL